MAVKVVSYLVIYRCADFFTPLQMLLTIICVSRIINPVSHISFECDYFTVVSLNALKMKRRDNELITRKHKHVMYRKYKGKEGHIVRMRGGIAPYLAIVLRNKD